MFDILGRRPKCFAVSVRAVDTYATISRLALLEGRLVDKKLRIRCGDVRATALLNDTPTADAIWQALPIEARASTWGDEIYFSIPVHHPVDNGTEVVSLGDLAFWPPGNAFCIFFGRTPVSRGDEIRAASAVNVVGRVDGDPRVFGRVASGARIILDKNETEG